MRLSHSSDDSKPLECRRMSLSLEGYVHNQDCREKGHNSKLDMTKEIPESNATK